MKIDTAKQKNNWFYITACQYIVWFAFELTTELITKAHGFKLRVKRPSVQHTCKIKIIKGSLT